MKKSQLLGGILLIAGTTVGAGMLALPVSMGLAGFFPAIGIFLACWLMMLWTAFLFLEVNLSLKGDVNLISMVQTTLGPLGSSFAWLGFLLLLYSLLAAYMTGSGPLFLDGVETFIGFDLPSWLVPFPILVLFAPFVYLGMNFVDYINRYLMIGLIFAYVVMIALLMGHVKSDLLFQVDFNYILLSFSVVFVSFGYHIIIPSLTDYLHRDIQRIKTCIWIGSLLPIVIYLLWEFVILGTIPVSGEYGIAHMMKENFSVSHSLQFILGNSTIALTTRVFALFAIITSFLGVAQSLFDFLRDGIKTPNARTSRLLIWALTFGPPLFFVAFFQKGFIAVLEYAGLFIAILLGVVPILMAWSARYIKKLETPYRVRGGKISLVGGLLFYLSVALLVIATHAGWVVFNVDSYI